MSESTRERSVSRRRFLTFAALAATAVPALQACSQPASAPAPKPTEAPKPAAAAPTQAAQGPRRIQHAEAPPVDLLETAGVPVVKRLLPLGIVALVLLLLLGRRRRRRR